MKTRKTTSGTSTSPRMMDDRYSNPCLDKTRQPSKYVHQFTATGSSHIPTVSPLLDFPTPTITVPKYDSPPTRTLALGICNSHKSKLPNNTASIPTSCPSKHTSFTMATNRSPNRTKQHTDTKPLQPAIPTHCLPKPALAFKSASCIPKSTPAFKCTRPPTLGLYRLLVGVVLVAALMACGVTAVPDWTGQCSICACIYTDNRKVAGCSSRGYTLVPSNLSGEVQVLNLSGNRITTIDANEFQNAGLVNLQLLRLNDNLIASIHEAAFTGLSILIELDLRHNHVDHLHPATFTGMEKLRKLDLSGNKLTRLEAYQFPPLLHLQILKLSRCNLSYVHNYAFANLYNVTTIELADNVLTTVQSELFDRKQKLVALELSNNHWNCDCRMRPFVDWMQASERFDKVDWDCFSPARLKGEHWQDVELDDFACEPSIEVAQEIVEVHIGSEASLTCWAYGDPLPEIKWVAGDQVISNMTYIRQTSDLYIVKMAVNNSVVYSTLELGVYGDHHPTVYTCVASNKANAVEKRISVVVGSGNPLDVTEPGGPSLFVLVIIGATVIVLLIMLIILVCCCWYRRRPETTTPHKLNGTATDHSNVVVVPAHSINPIGKPPRQYEKVPQKDIEMTHISNASTECVTEGGHQSYGEVDYPANNSMYSDPRSRLPPLEEEGMSSQHMPHSMAPSPTLTLQSNVTQTTTSHYPDLLDNARVPRTVSPTQMSYQSLAYPPIAQDWRNSYAPPTDYSRSPGAFSTPQHQRPGYVTLPRRPRAPSWSGMPTPNPHVVANPMLSPQAMPTHTNTIYDTLGPRTTADGTSTTDLTRPGSRAALYEPFPPAVVAAAAAAAAHTPTSPLALAAHYNSMAANKYNSKQFNYQANARPGVSQTLPRSAPNLLEDQTLSMPLYQRALSPQIEDANAAQPQALHSSNGHQEPLTECSELGIPYEPSFQYDPTNTDEGSNLIVNGEYYGNDVQQPHNNNNNSKNNYNNVKSSTMNPNKTPLHQEANKAMNTSASPSPSSVLTPTQILSSAGLGGDLTTAYPPLPAAHTVGPVAASSPNSVHSSSSAGTLGKKKVPPKPPPKPASKRLSVTSMTSDAGNNNNNNNNNTSNSSSRKGSVSTGFQDEGPDGSEV